MNGRHRTFVVFVIACAIVLGSAGAAFAASAFEQTYNAYRHSGRVPPCQFSVDTLKKAKSEVPPDIEQYAPDFPAALDAALQARALGACNPHPSSPTTSAATPAAPPTTPGGQPPATGSSAGGTPSPTPLPAGNASVVPTAAAASHSAGASSAPAPVIALAIVLVLMAMAALWWSLTTWRGLEPRWLVGARHAWSEAGYRASGTWAEFTDWVRFGR
jgi:hypothetical protein